MRAWLQKHDLSSEEFDISDAASAKKALRDFDWQCELNRQAQATSETCPPGLGLVTEGGEILHICPGNDVRCIVHFHFSSTRKLFGLFSRRVDLVKTFTHVSLDKTRQMIDAFFVRDFESIKRMA